jgi:hypothetical protein
MRYGLRYNLRGCWDQRENLVEMLNYRASGEVRSGNWKEEPRAARLVSGAVKNGHAC